MILHYIMLYYIISYYIKWPAEQLVVRLVVTSAGRDNFVIWF